MTNSNEICKRQIQPAWNGVTGHTGTSWAIDLPGDKSAVAVARKCALNMLDDDRHAYAVELIVSELVTNAVLWSASGEREDGRVRVELETWPCGAVRIDVIDQGSRATVHVPPDPNPDPGGLGLVIVKELAAEVGEDVPEGGGRRTWALIA